LFRVGPDGFRRRFFVGGGDLIGGVVGGDVIGADHQNDDFGMNAVEFVVVDAP
jgi:hypothetical protein